ncbi:hypothetical protein RUND412_002721 [Rhizina undulata]
MASFRSYGDRVINVWRTRKRKKICSGCASSDPPSDNGNGRSSMRSIEGRHSDSQKPRDTPPLSPKFSPTSSRPLNSPQSSSTELEELEDLNLGSGKENGEQIDWMLLEFLRSDKRPTLVIKVTLQAQTRSSFSSTKAEISFENSSLQRLKPSIDLDLESPSSALRYILDIDYTDHDPIEWMEPEGIWRCQCVTIQDKNYEDKKRVKWRIVTFENIAKYHEEPVMPMDFLENFGGRGESDVRRMSIAEEPFKAGKSTFPEDSETGSIPYAKTMTSHATLGSRRQSLSYALSFVTSRRSSRSSASTHLGSRRSSMGTVSSGNSVATVILTKKSNNINPKPLDWTRELKLSVSKETEEYYQLLRSVPWHETSLGPLSHWPNSLRCISNAIMSFPHPTVLYWGEDLVSIYNEAWKQVAQARHPDVLGKKFEESWPELKDYFKPLIEKAFQGETTKKEDEILFIDRSVPKEESYYTFYLSPIVGESGVAEGILEQAYPRTSEVISKRRMESLQKMRELVELVRDFDRDNFWTSILDGLGTNKQDTPFAMLYKVISEKECALAGSLGIPEPLNEDLVPPRILIGGKIGRNSVRTGSSSSVVTKGSAFSFLERVAPDRISLGEFGGDILSLPPVDEEDISLSSTTLDYDDPFIFFQEMLLAKRTNTVVLKDLTELDSEAQAKLALIEYRGFGDPCTHAVIIPIQPSPSRTHGFLILGLNPRRPYDCDYQRWISMVMEQIATSVGRIKLLTEDLLMALDEAHYQKQLTLQALERKRQQENFIDISSHELRNPLSAVLQSAEGILNTLTNPKFHGQESELLDAIESAKTILICVAHQSRIIEDILTLSKLDSSLMSVVPVSVDPRELVTTSLRIFEAEFAEKGISLNFKILEGYKKLGVEWVYIDPSRMTQILVNLITNAIKFTASKESMRNITVTLDAFLQRPADTSEFMYLPMDKIDEDEDATSGSEWGTGEILYVSITVKDTGIGISKQNQVKLFQRFTQVPKTHVTYGGSGLGLYISRKLCHLQGGNIGVSSEECVGSVFSFYIKARRAVPPSNPSSSNSTPKPTRPRMPPRSPQRSYETIPMLISNGSQRSLKQHTRTTYRVLIVEDNLINQKVLQQQLKAEGCISLTANNGVEALETILRSSFTREGGEKLDIVLMDMEMPIMDGVTATIRIRQLEGEGKMLKHVPIIGISANARLEQLDQMTKAGMDDAISKPFRIPDLVARFPSLIDQPDGSISEKSCVGGFHSNCG